ncbi:MAG: sulfurtransferase [Pseudomonadota bacterium]
MPYTTLISIADLARHFEHPDWRIIDCRFDLADTTRGRTAYRAAHIPGAVYAHLDEDLSAPMIPGKTGRHPLPAQSDLVATLSHWGIDGRVQVVAYDDSGGPFAARLWWLLRWLGHEHVAVLDGGWRHWVAARLPVCDAQCAPVARSFTPQPRPYLAVDADDVLRALDDPAIKLLDARAADRYRGENETLDPKAGHIPGALSAPFMGNLDSAGRFLDQESLRARYRALLGATTAANTIAYCGSGVTAAHDILAMLHAGLGDARLYAGSWSHWITDPARPIETGG